MDHNVRSILRSLLLAFFLICPGAFVRGDGGTVRLSERKAGCRITVFTAPTPLRAGPVDISVLVQDDATGEPIPEIDVTVRAMPRDHPSEAICLPATTEASTNKLFQSSLFELPEAGWWNVEIAIEGLREPVQIRFAMEVAEPLPRALEMWPWISWPALVIVLFGVHQWLVRRQSKIDG
jgi:hypothetical protein